MLASDILIFIAACLVMLASGSAIVKSLEIVTEFLRLTEFVVGFILIGITTSLPELFVGINSAIIKSPSITLGNVIGANILDITLIMGIIVVFARGIKYQHKTVSHDSWIMLGSAALPLLLMEIGNQISRIDGIILLFVFLMYLRRLVSKRKPFKKEFEENHISKLKAVCATALFSIAIFTLMLSANFVAKYGSKMAAEMLLPPIFIGIFFVSFGTTLPELVTGLISVKQHHYDFAVGDIVGSVITNSLLVLGITSIIYPITANIFLFITSAAYLILVCFLFTTFIESGKRLLWQEGIAMILLYVFFLIVELNLKGFF